ncbi:MAG: glycoside hydrolase family 3 N-terminal domain-containing protein, partial [Planctomycetota bacterium]
MLELDYSNSATVFESHKNNVPAGIEADAKYLNPDLPIEERVEDLIGRMTPDEKASQMLNDAPAIERLGIPRYEWWSEALHGIARAGKATVFPQAINLGATFDPELIHRVASAISDEGRAKHHAAANAGNRGRSRGLTFWSPTVNLIRDPRWGRGHESYGEDPYHLGVMGTAFVRGMQGDDARGKPLGKFMKVGACAKHYAVHSGPEGKRHNFNAIASKKDMQETYLP